jgi:hypothetical protein
MLYVTDEKDCKGNAIVTLSMAAVLRITRRWLSWLAGSIGVVEAACVAKGR